MPPKKKVANGYKFAVPLPEGMILIDLGKKRWRLGPSIGQGGFGAIYSAQEENSKSKLYPYVVKIEPHTNGPLFVEINFYIRHARPEFIEDFKKERSLKTFGMPVYHGSGSLEFKGEKYRFLVMDKFHTDLYTLFINNNKVFPTDTVFKIGLQILDVLEFIHQRGYVHADIKASNVLLEVSKGTEYKQTYLVDFGLATKYTMDKEFKPNPKKAHDGTIEFLSRDAHQGVQTRRGDLEILAYNLIQWLGCKLPWENNLSDPRVVQGSKEANMATVSKMIEVSFGSKTPPKAIVDFLKYLKTLKFDTEPDYEKIRNILTSGVNEAGGSIGTPLKFSISRTPSKRKSTPYLNSKTGKSGVKDNEQETEHPKKKARTKNNFKSSKNDGDANTSDNGEETPKPKKKSKPKKDFVVDSGNSGDMATLDNNIAGKDLSNELDMEGYTDAMKQIMLKKLKTAGQTKRVILTQKTQSPKTHSEDAMSGFTKEMKAIALKKKAKGNTSKNISTGVPVPTTSKVKKTKKV